MKIRTKLTLMFFSIVILILTGMSVSVFYFSSNYQQEDFIRRLKNRAINVGKVLLEVKEVDADLLKRLEQNNPASLPNQYVIIFDQTDKVVFQSNTVQPILIDSALIQNIRKKEISYTEHDFVVTGFTMKQPTGTFTIIAAASDVYGINALQNLQKILLITFCVSVVMVSLIGWIYAGNVLQPISNIVSKVNTITEENLNQRLDEGDNKDELSKLANAFNDLLKRLQKVFLSQKFFIANASHEIKTPITVMTGAVEVALLQERTKEYYSTLLHSLHANLNKLNVLSGQLLLLAQTSSASEKNFASLRVDDIFWDVKSELQKAHPEYKIEILFDLNVDHESFLIEGDEQLLQIAVQNLMDNGCKYSPDHQITIHLQSHDPNYITAVFENTGAIEPENIDKIFEPLFRERHSRHVEGFGIGLSLVYWIAKLHGGEISVLNVLGKVRFALKLPIKD
jgi:signal transduction histidine kinase